MRTLRFCTALLMLLGTGSAQAISLADAQEQALSLDLDQHPTWLHLLEFAPGGQNSEVETEDFFLSRQGRVSARAELLESLVAFFSVENVQEGQHAQCRFPARYFWLRTQLKLPDADLPTPKCSALYRWLKPQQLRSISVVMVSGYYGSPAATFGHALLKLNNGQQSLRRGLLDHGANFGATVPPEDGPIIYAYKGLFGGYEGGFTSDRFYLQDRLYARIQSRDMWEYELALGDDEKLLVALHLWELIGKQFNYYFLRQNCAYRIARLLELGLHTNLTGRAHRPYPPALLFHEITELDAQTQTTLIRDVRYIPSPKRQVGARFDALDPDQFRVAEHIMESHDVSMIERLSQSSQVPILDALIAYFGYQLAMEAQSQSEQFRDIQQKLLLLRLALPMQAGAPAPERRPVQSAPHFGTRPVRFGAGLVANQKNGGAQSLHASLFNSDILSRSAPLGSVLSFGDLELRMDQDEGLYLQQFQLVDLQNLRDFRPEFPGAERWSWRFRTGLAQTDSECVNCLEMSVRGGIGQAIKVSSLTTYLMTEAIAASRDEAFALQPSAGVVLGNPQMLSVALEFGYRLHPGAQDNAVDNTLVAALALGHNSEMRLTWKDHRAQELSLTLNMFW